MKKGYLKRCLAVTVVVTTFLTSTLAVSAAGWKDYFDAEYYISENPDVVAVLGTNKNKLYQHLIILADLVQASCNSRTAVPVLSGR